MSLLEASEEDLESDQLVKQPSQPRWKENVFGFHIESVGSLPPTKPPQRLDTEKIDAGKEQI